MLYSFAFPPSITSLQHFDLVAMASLSLLSGPTFLAVLLKCDFLCLVVKKGYWVLQISCCFSSVSASLLSFLFFCFICLCFPLLSKPACPLHTGSPPPLDHYHSSIFLHQHLRMIFPFSLLCFMLSISPSFFFYLLPKLFSTLFDSCFLVFLRCSLDVLGHWLKWRKDWKWTRWSFGILSKARWRQKRH